MTNTHARGTGPAQCIAPTVHDKHPEVDRSWPRVMAMFWAHDVDIQFGKGRSAFFREADKRDIADLIARVRARMKTEEYPKFTIAVLRLFSKVVVYKRYGGPITLQWWWVRMLRDLATNPKMIDATNRFPSAGVLDVPHISTADINRKLRAAGFGESARRQMSRAKNHPRKPVTLPKLHTEESENA